MTIGRVEMIARYPVKGLSAEPLTEARLEQATGMSGDREWALVRASGKYRRGTAPAYSDREFHVLKRDPRLAGLETSVADAMLIVKVRDHVVLEARLDQIEGQAAIGKLFARVLDLPPHEMPFIAHQEETRFTDAAPQGRRHMNAISIINLGSVRELSAACGEEIDPLRFRANIYVDGLAPWSEFEWLDERLSLGSAVAVPFERTSRCRATEVNRSNARRDIPIPRALIQKFGHCDMGVYAEVVKSGAVAVGSDVSVSRRGATDDE